MQHTSIAVGFSVRIASRLSAAKRHGWMLAIRLGSCDIVHGTVEGFAADGGACVVRTANPIRPLQEITAREIVGVEANAALWLDDQGGRHRLALVAPWRDGGDGIETQIADAIDVGCRSIAAGPLLMPDRRRLHAQAVAWDGLRVRLALTATTAMSEGPWVPAPAPATTTRL
jgi:hypothetical protein